MRALFRTSALGPLLLPLSLLVACGSSDSDLFGEATSPTAGAGGVAGSSGAGGSNGGKGGSGNGGKGGKGGTSSGGSGQAGDGGTDTGGTDAGGTDAGGTNSGGTDAGGSDAGGTDAGGTNAGGTNAGGTDAGGTDSGGTNSGGTDAGGSSSGGTDAGGTDAGGMDAGGTNAGGTDAGGTSGGGTDAGGTNAGGTSAGGAGQGGGGAGGSGPVDPDKCPGEAVALVPGTLTAKGNTANFKNDYNSGTTQCGGGNSNEVVYTATAKASGYVKIELQADNFNPSLYVRRECNNPNTRVACGGSFNNSVTLQFPVLEGATFSVFVDGFGTGNEAGPYTLKMTLTPSVCGNNTIDPGEDCDDGNNNAGDGCSACKLDAVCIEPESAENTLSSPQTAPAECSTMTYFPASLSSGNDNDWFCTQAKEGQTITSQTYTGAPGFCFKTPNNTLIELYKGTPANQPGGILNCLQSGALACNDDFNGQGVCSRIVYKVPSGQGGSYCTRVIKGPSLDQNPIPEYGIQLTVK